MPDSIGKLYIGEPNAHRWRGLYDTVAKEFINDATISWVIRAANADGSYSASGALVTNGSGSMSLDTQNDGVTPSETGDYVGTIADDAALTLGSTYWIIDTALDSTAAVIGSRKTQYVAALHGSTK